MLRHRIHRALFALVVVLATPLLSLFATAAPAHAAPTLPTYCVEVYPTGNIGATVCTPWH